MTKLSVIIPVYNGENEIENTLKSLIEQTVENFEIIVVDDGSVDSTADIVKKYCDEYVDFYYIKQEKSGIYAAFNTGIEKAKGEYLMFLHCGDIITAESIEAIFAKSEAGSFDMILGRLWIYGDVEQSFTKKDDTLVVMPEIDKLETSLLWSNDISNKVIKKKICDLYGIRFGDLSAYGEMLFVFQCIMQCASIGGCTDFVAEKKIEHLTKGYSESELPTFDNLQSAVTVTDEIYSSAVQILQNKIGKLDGDETFLQAVMYRSFALFIDDFYKKFWFCEENTLEQMREQFNIMSKSIKKEKFEQLITANPNLRLPYIYINKEEAVNESLYSLMIDVPKNALNSIIKSIYLQDLPFFEVLVKKDDYDSEEFPENIKELANLKVIESDNFYKASRIAAKGKFFITVRGTDEFDPRLLSTVASTKTLKSFVPYVFSTKRKSLHTRKVLKEKGLNMS